MPQNFFAEHIRSPPCHNSPVQLRRIVVLLAAATAFACTSTVTFLGPHPPPFCDRGTLGIEPGDISHALRASLKLAPDATGAVVAEVMPGGPAEAAGVMKNDVVVRVGIKTIANACDLIDTAFDRRTCDPASVAVLRGGKTLELLVTPVDQATFFKKSCASGNVTGCFRMGWLTWSGDGVPHDEERAMEIYADACRRGAAEACAFRGLHLLDDTDAKADDVVATLTRACDLGSSAGCAHLAFLYATGTVVARDDKRATPLYVRACDLGDARGCYNVGLMYADGRGVPADVARAIAAYDEGCRGGSSTACTNLGYAYEHGEGVTQDEKRSVELYRLGCEGTSCQPANRRACVNVGRAYRDGIGVEKDPAHAAQIFETACHRDTDSDDVDAEANQARACALLGALYLEGDGVKKDLDSGRELSERACEANDAFGCFNAGRIYATGLGIEADLAAAARFFDTACEADDGESCYELALLYEEGNGVDRDASHAAELMRRACKLGFEKSCK
jgi:TPR repeat protein